MLRADFVRQGLSDYPKTKKKKKSKNEQGWRGQGLKGRNSTVFCQGFLHLALALILAFASKWQLPSPVMKSRVGTQTSLNHSTLMELGKVLKTHLCYSSA